MAIVPSLSDLASVRFTYAIKCIEGEEGFFADHITGPPNLEASHY
jgi:hypothetical protein